jgi:outer membrane phospholipase A
LPLALGGKEVEVKNPFLKKSSQLIATISHLPNNPFKRQEISFQVSNAQQIFIDLEAHLSRGLATTYTLWCLALC